MKMDQGCCVDRLLFFQLYVCAWTFSVKCYGGHNTKQSCLVFHFLQKADMVSHKPYDILETHLHYLIFSQEVAQYFLQCCTETQASGWNFNGKEHPDNRWLVVRLTFNSFMLLIYSSTFSQLNLKSYIKIYFIPYLFYFADKTKQLKYIYLIK